MILKKKIRKSTHWQKEIKEEFYGNRIVMFAPLYLSNYCINGCEYCPYHARNKHIARKKLSQEEIGKEVTALQDMGHKRLALEAGEDPSIRSSIFSSLSRQFTVSSIKTEPSVVSMSTLRQQLWKITAD